MKRQQTRTAQTHNASAHKKCLIIKSLGQKVFDSSNTWHKETITHKIPFAKTVYYLFRALAACFKSYLRVNLTGKMCICGSSESIFLFLAKISVTLKLSDVWKPQDEIPQNNKSFLFIWKQKWNHSVKLWFQIHAKKMEAKALHHSSSRTGGCFAGERRECHMMSWPDISVQPKQLFRSSTETKRQCCWQRMWCCWSQESRSVTSEMKFKNYTVFGVHTSP